MATYRGGYNNMNSRNELFGQRAAGTPGAGAYGGQSYAEQTQALQEEENNQRSAVLGEQVSRLKELSLQINGEVNTQNKLLDGMGGTFGQTGELMSGTMKKLQHMINTGGSKHMCYLICFVVAVFFVLYFLLMGR